MRRASEAGTGYRSAERGPAKLNSSRTVASISIGTGRIHIPAIAPFRGDTGKSREVRDAHRSTIQRATRIGLDLVGPPCRRNCQDAKQLFLASPSEWGKM
jgi:hypothetical protein